MLIDGDPEWLEGFQDFVAEDGQIVYTPWFEFSPEQIAHRNAAIRARWADPELRAKHSATLKKAHRNNEATVNAKRSAAIKKSHSSPEVRAKMSAARTLYWKAWRERRASGINS